MKKALLVLGLLVLSATVASAQVVGQTKRNVGCGLGTMIFGEHAETTLFQVFAATTNGTFGNQTFGITFGTLECERPARFVTNERLQEFVHANLDDLAQDIASGRGETVETLAELLSVSPEKRVSFYRNLQTHFAEIFPSADVEYAHVVDTIVRLSAQG
jgi:hypothetical protein